MSASEVVHTEADWLVLSMHDSLLLSKNMITGSACTNGLSLVETGEADLADPMKHDMEFIVFCLESFGILPENELLTEAQCKSITEACILHYVNNLAPAEAALPFHKPA